MTEQELQAMKEIYFGAVGVANKFGPLMIEETDGDIPITTTAAAILLAGFCIQAGISMHDAVDVLVSAYKHGKEFEEDQS